MSCYWNHGSACVRDPLGQAGALFVAEKSAPPPGFYKASPRVFTSSKT
jgi:hypothetical protein